MYLQRFSIKGEGENKGPKGRKEVEAKVNEDVGVKIKVDMVRRVLS